MSIPRVPNSVYDLSSLVCKAEALSSFLSQAVENCMLAGMPEPYRLEINRLAWLASTINDVLTEGVEMTGKMEDDIMKISG